MGPARGRLIRASGPPMRESMEWQWIVLGAWYLGLVHVVAWNWRSRPDWRTLDAYPMDLRFRLLLPLPPRRWQDRVRTADLATLARFRRGFALRCYGWVILVPLLTFGWLYGSTLYRYTSAVERRERLELELERIVSERTPPDDTH